MNIYVKGTSNFKYYYYYRVYIKLATREFKNLSTMSSDSKMLFKFATVLECQY